MALDNQKWYADGVNQREVYVKPVHSRTVLALAALTLSGAMLSGCAANNSAETPIQVASRGPDPCFRNGDIINVNIIDKQTLYVATQRGYVYKLDAPGGCFIQGAPITVGAFSGGPGAGTCIGSQARVAVGSSFRFPSSQCIAEITGPYTDSRQSGLWSRPAGS